MHALFWTGELLEFWWPRILWGSLQGAVVIMLVWLTCRVWTGCPPNIRCWLWRAAYLKFALVLIAFATISLPWLPARPVAPTPGPLIGQGEREPPPNGRLAGSPFPAVGAVQVADPGEVQPARAPVVLQILLAAWLVGVTATLIQLGRRWLQSRRLLATARPLEDAALRHLYRELCRQYRISAAPRLAVSPLAESAVLVGGGRAAIILPPPLIDSLSQDELRLVLAHELAHFRRRDLCWNWLPALVRCLFFFHPLIWLAERRWSRDQELACDELTISVTGATLQRYGEMLVHVSSLPCRGSRPSFAMLGIASTYTTLKARILAMNQFKKRSSTARLLCGLSALTIAAAMIVPWKLVAQDPQAQDRREKTADAVVITGKVRGTDETTADAQGTVQVSESGRRPGSSTMISVNDGDVAESIKLRWDDDGRISVTYERSEGNTEFSETLQVDDLRQLEKQNPRAYEFYQEHSTPRDKADAIVPSTGENQATTMRRSKQSPRASQASKDSSADQQSSSQSSSASMSQRSTASSSGGNVTRTFESSRQSNSSDGAAVDQLIRQLEQAINEADDPQIKDALRKAIEQLRKN